MSRISSSEPGPVVRWPLLYLGVAFTTLATLIVELALTRIFSVVFYYHLAFLAISIALFGLGAGGVFSYLVADWRGGLYNKLGILALADAAAVVLALGFLLTRTGDLSNATLAAVYLASALPFFFSGAVISLAIGETIDRVDRVYFFDLIGAAAGCLLLIPLLNSLNGPNTVITAAVLFSVAGAIWFELGKSLRGRIIAVLVGLALVGLVAYNAKNRVIDIRYAKGQQLGAETFVKWNSYSRIALAPERGSDRMAIYIDADASTGVANFDTSAWTEEDRRKLLVQGPGLAYAMRPGAKALIIGPGGGWDVTRALASGSKDITGVEINAIIADTIMRERFPNLSRNLYLRPDVHIFVEDGRSFVRRSTEKYQVLQATLVDTWASTAAGAFALSENNLYTTDAFEDYLEHLTDDGLMAFTRWGFDPPRESLRLVTLAIDALERMGETEVWRHIVVARENVQLIDAWGATDTVLISRKPFSDQDTAHAREVLREGGMKAVYLPGDGQDSSPFAKLLLSKDRSTFLDGYPYDVSAVSDNRPFFFYTVQPRDLWQFFTATKKDSADYKINRAVPLLFGLVGVTLGAMAVMLALPPLLLGSRLPREPGLRLFLLLFVCIGTGYILIQVALIQKFVLFLGHPTRALWVIIFSMLVSSGAGSFYSRRFAGSGGGELGRVLIAVAALVAVLAFAVTPLTGWAVGWPLAARVITTIVLIAPVGFAMGMPFPTALGMLESRHPASVRWAWSINAAASVLGSALAIFFALYLGLRATLLLGGLLYVLALLTLGSQRPASSAAR
ncbi:MAG: hypothetical protein R2762_14140 [Bryobacteraceae bacterium]